MHGACMYLSPTNTRHCTDCHPCLAPRAFYAIHPIRRFFHLLVFQPYDWNKISRHAPTHSLPTHNRWQPHMYCCLSRLFLQELPDNVSKYPAGVKSRLKACGHLHHFNSLKDKDTNWDMEDQDISVEDSHLPLVFIDNTPPSKKKRKLWTTPNSLLQIVYGLVNG